MKVAEAVARFLQEKGLTHVFGVNGGANLHLIHGVCDVTTIQFIPGTHECNSGFAADAYARVAGLGCAMATSGPGATNLITAIATSYYDSVPVLYITGNVATFRFGSRLGVRQYGFQETPIVDMVKDITKYAKQAVRADDVIPLLQIAIEWMNTGRKGPALIDIPDDIQRADTGWSPELSWMVEPTELVDE
jgi:acetolactate synthase-1/2/3 large subunit